MLSVSNEGTPNIPTTITSYSYDNVGNVLSIANTINGNLSVATTHEYDALNRMTVNTQGNKRVDYAYNAISQVTNKKRYSDNNLVAETNHIYDSSDRLINITHSNGANAISYAQTYDAGSKITSVTGIDGSSTYTYDDTNQLTGADYDFQTDESYTYDSNGNRTNTGNVTGVNNRLLEDDKYLYAYDLVGNRIRRIDKLTDEEMDYSWDIRDRLTGITVKDVNGNIIKSAQYKYDVYNQRIAKTFDADGDGAAVATTERYVYGRDQNIGLVFDENGNLNHRYLFGDGVDQIEADESNGTVLWALSDHLGSVRDVVDDSGVVLNHIVYDAFGGVTSQSNASVVFRYGYTARELDAESGLQYNRARYLDSFTGKFISEDPISFQGGDSNLYRYVFNSPIEDNDPSGLQTASDDVPSIPGIPFLDLGAIFQGIGNGISEIGQAIERALVPPAEAPTFPSNTQASKKGKPSPTPSPSPKPIPVPDPLRGNEPYHPFCPADDEKNRESSMRIEVQYGTVNDYGIPARAFDRKGVTLTQVLNTITEFDNNVKARVPLSRWFPLKDFKSQFDKGVSRAKEKANDAYLRGGTDGGSQILSSVKWIESGQYNNSGKYRVELINKAGRNLTSL